MCFTLCSCAGEKIDHISQEACLTASVRSLRTWKQHVISLRSARCRRSSASRDESLIFASSSITNRSFKTRTTNVDEGMHLHSHDMYLVLVGFQRQTSLRKKARCPPTPYLYFVLKLLALDQNPRDVVLMFSRLFADRRARVLDFSSADLIPYLRSFAVDAPSSRCPTFPIST